MHAKSLLWSLALVGVGVLQSSKLTVATDTRERPSMGCDTHGQFFSGADNNPAVAKNHVKTCKPRYDKPNRMLRELEGKDADYNNKAEGVRRLEGAFNTTFVTNVHQLPNASNIAHTPWPGSYWATSRDGINYRWKSRKDPSPSEKYAVAFGMNVKDLRNNISAITGVNSVTDNAACNITNTSWEFSFQGPQEQSTCAYGQVCGTRFGSKAGYCFAMWEGICHSWAPASILEPEPKCPVVENNITFYARDLKALITQVYFESNETLIFTGARFDGDNNAPENMAKDKYGRFLNDSRRDLGPGFFHLAVTNVLGRLNKTVIVDKSSNSDVWNHPILSYEINATEYHADANALSMAMFNEPKYPFNDNAKHLMQVTNVVKLVIESDLDGGLTYPKLDEQHTTTIVYEYLLELDQDDNVIGGEWLGKSREEHPDFLWAQLTIPTRDFVAPSSGIQYGHVRDLIDRSIAQECPQQG